jgi:hypothetical protein
LKWKAFLKTTVFCGLEKATCGSSFHAKQKKEFEKKLVMQSWR